METAQIVKNANWPIRLPHRLGEKKGNREQYRNIHCICLFKTGVLLSVLRDQRCSWQTHALYSLVLFLLYVFMVRHLWQLDNTNPDRSGALQKPPDLLDPQILTPNQSCDLVRRRQISEFFPQNILLIKNIYIHVYQFVYLLNNVWHPILFLIWFCGCRRFQG